jgi:serine/threonine protein kinase
MSPEAIKTSLMSIENDVWGFGVLAWELMSDGTLPYGDDEESTIVARAWSGTLALLRPRPCPPNVWTIIDSCFRLSPEHRPSFLQLETMLDLVKLSLGGQLGAMINIDHDATPQPSQSAPLSTPLVIDSQLSNEYTHHQSSQLQRQPNISDIDAATIAGNGIGIATESDLYEICQRRINDSVTIMTPNPLFSNSRTQQLTELHFTTVFGVCPQAYVDVDGDMMMQQVFMRHDSEEEVHHGHF